MSGKVIAGLMAIALLLQACGDKAQTVEWYREHEAERKDKVKWCNDDAARGITPDCMNASKAAQLENVTNGTRTFDRNYKFK